MHAFKRIPSFERLFVRKLFKQLDKMASVASVGISSAVDLPSVTCAHKKKRYVLRTGTARIACGAGSTKRYGVRPSVCPSMGPQQQTRCCRFAAVGPAGRRYTIGCCSSDGRMRVVAHCQRTQSTDLIFTACAGEAHAAVLIFVGGDFEFFCPAGAIRCTDGGEIWRE